MMPTYDELTQRYADLLDDPADAELVDFLGKLETVHAESAPLAASDMRQHLSGAQIANGAPVPPALNRPARLPSPARRRWNTLAAVAALVALAVASGALFQSLHHARGQTPAAKPLTALPFATYLHGLAMVSATEGWAVGETYDASVDETQDPLTPTPPKQPAQGLILRYHNGGWSRYALKLPHITLQSIVMTAPDAGWITGQVDAASNLRFYGPYAGGQLILLQYAAGQWRQVSLPDSQGYEVGYLYQGANGDAWLAADNFGQAARTTALYHEREGQWAKVALPPDFHNLTVNGVAQLGADEYWLAANTTGGAPANANAILFHWANHQWTTTQLAAHIAIAQITMLAPDNGWVAATIPQDSTGSHAYLLHYDGKIWQRVKLPNLPLPNNALEDMAFLTPTDGWVIGTASKTVNTPEYGNALVYHFDGTAWQTEQAQTPASIYSLNKLAMISSTEGWAIASRQATYPQSGGEGFAYPSNLLRYDGARWQVALPDSEG